MTNEERLARITELADEASALIEELPIGALKGATGRSEIANVCDAVGPHGKGVHNRYSCLIEVIKRYELFAKDYTDENGKPAKLILSTLLGECVKDASRW